MEEVFLHIVELFPDISSKVAWSSLLASGVVAILSMLIEPLKREDRFGHPVARISMLIILVMSLIVLVLGLSLWWLLLGLLIPPIWLAIRWYSFFRKLKSIRMKKNSERDILLRDYVDSLTKKKLFEWEIRRFLLPNLLIFFRIGAIKRLKTEISNLKEYRDSDEVNELQSMICSIEHRPQEMIDRLKQLISKCKNKTSDKDYPRYLNNLFHAAMMREDTNGITYAFEKIEDYVATESNVTCIPVEMLEAMMYRYDTTNNEQGISQTFALIESRKPRTFDEYLHLNDIILYYNKRHDNGKGIIDYFNEAYTKLEEMERDEEQRLRFRLRMVQLHFEYNYGWKEITVQLFTDAEKFLSYSQDVAIEYVKMVAGALRDAFSIYGQTLMPEQEKHLVTQTVTLVEQYLHSHRKQLFEYSDEYLYRKRDAHRFLMELARIKALVDYHYDKFIKQMIETHERILELCQKNEEKSEYIHTLMAFIDEFIVHSNEIERCILNGCNDYGIAKANKLIKSTYPRILELFDIYKKILAESNFDRAFSYNTLYAAYYSKCFGNIEDAKFYLTKFEAHEISAKNYRAPIQSMYENLKLELN